MRAFSIIVAVALAACAVEEPPPEPLASGDLAVFASESQPVLDRRCADPSCHARDDRPFAIYSPGRRRADPSRLFMQEPLTADELAANARVFAAFAPGEPTVDDCLILRKPLAIAAGGAGHLGGELFAGRDDADYQGLRAFLATLEAP